MECNLDTGACAHKYTTACPLVEQAARLLNVSAVRWTGRCCSVLAVPHVLVSLSLRLCLSVCLCLWSRRLWAGVLALSCAHSFWLLLLLLLLLLLFGLAGSALTQAVHLGTNAVHLKDRAVYLAVLHLKPTAGRREYINLPYLFEDKPPFRILRVARHPLQLSRGTRQQGFVFASSLALIDEDCLVVGYTVNDRTSSFLKTSLDLLLTQQFLSSVQQR